MALDISFLLKAWRHRPSARYRNSIYDNPKYFSIYSLIYLNINHFATQLNKTMYTIWSYVHIYFHHSDLFQLRCL